MRVWAAPGLRLVAWLGGMHVVDSEPGGRGGTTPAPRTFVLGDPVPGSGSDAPTCWG